MARGDSYQLQGQQGGIVLTTGDIAGTGNALGPFRWIQVVTDTVFGIIDSFDPLEGITIPAGTGIGGRINTIEITSGTVIAYYA
jgi:hypothetical protein